LLAELFCEKEEFELGADVFQEISTQNEEYMTDDAYYNYGNALEHLGKTEEALKIFDTLLKRNFHYKDVNHRVTELKQRVVSKQSEDLKSNRETIGGKAPKEIRYEMIDELGRGAMGVVFKARDRLLDRVVAYKTLPHTMKNDKEALENLAKEAQTAAKLNHPSIVTIYDVGEEDGTYFIAMEYADGKTLQEVLKLYHRITGNNFLHIAKALCSAVFYAHEQRIIHRDIKPSNIILMPNRSVKLMDFGLAKILQDLAIDKTMLRGTPLYMSPEQVLGKDIDHRCDIYALGVVFYEMLAGKPPFTEGDIMYAHLHTEPKPLVEVVTDVPKSFSSAIMRCLEKDKTKRPDSARSLWVELTQ
ncbi:MAG: protein kinase, partial [Bdellovibrionales bacterium]|nr:protein kinase [Bdellovibrionales bacterium]